MALLIIKDAFSELFSKIWKYLIWSFAFVVVTGALAYASVAVAAYFSFEIYFVLLFVVYLILGFFAIIAAFSIYIGRLCLPKNLLSAGLFAIIQSAVSTGLSYGGVFLINYFFYYLDQSLLGALSIVWSCLTMLLTIPLGFALFEMFKNELSLKEGFAKFVEFFRCGYFKKILLYVRVGLMLFVIFAAFALIGIIMVYLSDVFLPLVFLAVPIMLAGSLLLLPLTMIALCAYFEECELY